jgi:hypothetical protein
VREKEEKAARTSETRKEWWDGNRATLAPETLEAMLVQHSRVLDQLYWMDHGHKVPVEDPDFVSVEEGVADLMGFLKDHGTVHLGAITKNEIPADWPSRKFWQDPELLARLEDENQQTKQYVRYGLLAALQDWRVVEFLQKNGWSWQQAADLVGYHTDRLNTVRHR